MAATPTSVVQFEAASLALDKAARPQFGEFIAALRAERENAVQVMLLCNGAEPVFTAKGAVQMLDKLIQRMTNAEKTLASYHDAVARSKKDT